MQVARRGEVELRPRRNNEDEKRARGRVSGEGGGDPKRESEEAGEVCNRREADA